MALTDLDTVKLYLGLDNESSDAQLEALITQTSAQIETVCDRTFATTTYRTWLDSDDARSLYLQNFPIQALYRVSSCRVTAMDISFSATNATSATVSVTGDAVITQSIAAGASTETTHLFADSASLTDLETAIELVSGWAVSIRSSYDQYPSADLATVASADALGTDVGLELPGDPQTVRLDASTGIVYGWFGVGVGTVFVNYRAGYDSTPSDLELIATKVVADAFRGSSRDGSLIGEKLGDYQWQGSVTLAIQGALAQYMKDLSPWIRMGA